MKLKEYRQQVNPPNVWEFVKWFIKTKEFKWLLLFLFLIWTVTVIAWPEIAVAVKNYILGKLR